MYGAELEGRLGRVELDPGELVPGETERDGLCTLEPGRVAGGELGRIEGDEGRTLPGETLEPRDGLAEGREYPPLDGRGAELDGRGAALEPREPWLEGRAPPPPPPPDPLEGEADDPLEPRCGSAKAEAGPRASRARPSNRALRQVFMGGS